MPESNLVLTVIQEHKAKKGAVIPILHEIQKQLGHIPPFAQKLVARELGMPVAEVNGIVSFYSLFRENPAGKHVIKVCKGTACYVKGTERVLDKLQEILKIEPGCTTEDGMFSLEVVRCLGACGLGPVMTINEKVYTRVKAEKLQEIISAYCIEQGKRSFAQAIEK